MSPHALLLIPGPGDPHGLVRVGPCGARPPIANRVVCPTHGPRWTSGEQTLCCLLAACHVLAGGSTDALVLVWEGAPVAEGLDRLIRCGFRASGGFERLCPPWDDGDPRATAKWAEAMAAAWAPILGCTVVALDAQGREVAP